MPLRGVEHRGEPSLTAKVTDFKWAREVLGCFFFKKSAKASPTSLALAIFGAQLKAANKTIKRRPWCPYRDLRLNRTLRPFQCSPVKTNKRGLISN